MGEKINTEKLNIIGLIILILGLGLIGFAVTGKVISNANTLNDYCSLNIECSNGKICCIISGPQSMCKTQEICNELKSNLNVETPLNGNYTSYINIGINLLIFAIIIFIIAYMAYKKEKKKNSARKRKAIR